MICKAAEFRVRPESLARRLDAVPEFVGAVAENEPGTRLYVSFQQADGEGRFFHAMVSADAEAERRHRGSAWVKRFTESL
jgi:quinol monooxygenase YgiN